MTVTEHKSRRICQRALRLIATLLLFCCCMAPQGLQAAEKAEEGAKKPDSSASSTENKELAPTTLTVTLQDEDGAAVVGVNLSAVAADHTGRSLDHATTDINGKAVFKHLKSGKYYFFANINALHSHAGYGMGAMIRKFKSSRSYYLSENRTFDLSADAESTFTIKRGAFVTLETYLQVVRSDKFVLINKTMGIEQIMPLGSIDYLQVYLPMRQIYQIVTIKDDDFDSWILEIYAHERLRIELL